jgi:SAM-dependent methyltransferase
VALSHLGAAIRRTVINRKSAPRTAGYYNDALDGVSDILVRARDASVLDIGCNRGHVSFQFAQNGAALIHGCDRYEPGVEAARELLQALPTVSRFEPVNLTGGPIALQIAFGSAYRNSYDIVLFLAVYHMLAKVMPRDRLNELVEHLAHRAGRYFVFRNMPEHRAAIEPVLKSAGLRCVHYSELSRVTGLKVIYAR